MPTQLEAAVDTLIAGIKKSGPQTEAGKAASARNATTHGLTSAQIVLPHEDAAAFDQLLRDLRIDHRPRTSIEELCIEQMAQATWKLRRLASIEKALWELDLAVATSETSPIHKMAAAFIRKKDDITGALGKLNRYETAARRMFHQAEATFRRHQRYAHDAVNTDVRRARDLESDIAAFAVQAVAQLRAKIIKTHVDLPKPNQTLDANKSNSPATP